MYETLTDHLEHFLGPIQSGKPFYSGSNTGVSVARFEDRPTNQALTFVTLGLGHHLLKGKQFPEIRQELVFCCYDIFADQGIESLMASVAFEVIKSHNALELGQVLGPRGNLFNVGLMDALYVTTPSYFPDQFHVYAGTKPQVNLSWLVPVSSFESRFIKEYGWEKFEDKLEKDNPDLLDLQRSSVA